MLRNFLFSLVYSLSLAVCCHDMAVAQGIFDDKDVVQVSRGVMCSDGLLIHPLDHLESKDLFNKHLKAQDDASQQGWGTWLKNNACFATKSFAEKVLDIANHQGRLVLAWNLNFYAINTLEEVTARLIQMGTTLVAGPVAGEVSYGLTKTQLKLCRGLVPGFEGYLAGVYAYPTKVFVLDPVIQHGPRIVKGSAKVAYFGAKSAYSVTTSLVGFLKNKATAFCGNY